MELALKEITNKNHIPLGMQYFAIYNQEKKALVGFARRYGRGRIGRDDARGGATPFYII